MKELGNFTLKEWKTIIQRFSKEKLKKLRARANKHTSDPLNFNAVCNHLHLEYLEFLKAYGDNDREGMVEEIIDLSNCCDILFSLLTKESVDKRRRRTTKNE